MLGAFEYNKADQVDKGYENEGDVKRKNKWKKNSYGRRKNTPDQMLV